MDDQYRAGLRRAIDDVFRNHPALPDHRRLHPWLTGALGDPHSGIWFIAENPSLGQIERVRDPLGGAPTEEAQWWASPGDKLFRNLLVSHGFKDAPIEAHGGWHCYITNLIKEADYAQRWRGSGAARHATAADAWLPVLLWELRSSRPRLVVALGQTVRKSLARLERNGLPLPRTETIQHYSYVALRPRGTQGPMHPDRVREYGEEMAGVARLLRELP